ncbi:hypothetical protein FRC10_002045 [Ceratobasidium sp. 414]|nr:hypothetical protein FRC10_002045 [Ceratobasidium sp. 414]
MYQAATQGKPMPPADSFCGLCGKSSGPLKKTECCNRTVCDDYGNYKLFTYSNNSCARNHDCYTRCCYHVNEGHGGDALSCKKCNSDHDGETSAWYLTNNYNFLEDIERANPPSFAPTACSKCGAPIKLNVEAVMHGPNGKECQRCSAALASSVPRTNMYAADGRYRSM